VSVDLIFANPKQADAYIGFQLTIPKRDLPGTCATRGHQPQDKHSIQAMFYDRTTTTVTVCPLEEVEQEWTATLPTGLDRRNFAMVTILGTPRPRSWPIPFSGYAPYDGAVNRNEAIFGGWSLYDLTARKGTFRLIQKLGSRTAIERMALLLGRVWEYPHVGIKYELRRTHHLRPF
jgi:hypothetical protein